MGKGENQIVFDMPDDFLVNLFQFLSIVLISKRVKLSYIGG